MSVNVTEREAREVVEAAREAEWKLPSFGRELSTSRHPAYRRGRGRRAPGTGVGSPAHYELGSEAAVIDRLRQEIEQRLEQLLDEAEKLRRALAALDPRRGSSSSKADSGAGAKPVPAPALPTARPRAGSASQARPRTAPGATKARVLGALSSERAITAGEVAAATGVPRGTVSTTLTKLTKSGEVRKAERGYQLAVSGEAAESPTVPTDPPA